MTQFALPVRVAVGGFYGATILEADGTYVADVRGDTDHNDRAYAIVRAVNAHDALVEAAKNVLAIENPRWAGYIRQEFARLRAAIAAAEGDAAQIPRSETE